MQDLKDATSEILYENYRATYLTKLNQQDPSTLTAERLLQLKQEEVRIRRIESMVIIIIIIFP